MKTRQENENKRDGEREQRSFLFCWMDDFVFICVVINNSRKDDCGDDAGCLILNANISQHNRIEVYIGNKVCR